MRDSPATNYGSESLQASQSVRVPYFFCNAELPTDLGTHPKKGLQRKRGPYRPIRLPVRKLILFQPIRRIKCCGTRKRLPPADKLIHLRYSSSFSNCSLCPNVSRGDDQQILADTDTVHSIADVENNDLASGRNALSLLLSVKFSTRGSSWNSLSATRITTGNSPKFW